MNKKEKKYYTPQRFLKKESVEKHRSDYAVFFTFLIIAALFWLLINLSQEYSLSYDMKVYLQNPPEDRMITEQIDSTVTFHITAQGFYLVKLEFMHPDQLMVNLKNYTIHRAEDNRYYISTQPLKEDIALLLGISPSQIGFSKNTLSFVMEKLAKKKVKVIPKLDIKFDDFYNLYKPYQIKPENILVYGPKEVIDTIDLLYTVPVHLTNVNESLEVTVKVDVGNNHFIRVNPEKVKIILEVEKFTQSSVQVPVSNPEKNKNIHTFPARVTVFYNVALKDFERVKSSDFTVVPDLEHVDLRKVSRLDLKVIRKPDFVRDLRVEPPRVEFIIEK